MTYERQSFPRVAVAETSAEFADLTDITYHRHVTDPTVRVAFQPGLCRGNTAVDADGLPRQPGCGRAA
jgi:hypothetical protein